MHTSTTSIRPPTETGTMNAIVHSAYGSADVLRLTRLPVPAIGPDDVLVRVRAASVNHADLVYLTGEPLIARLAFGIRKPKEAVRGKDVAGIVESVGENVAGFRSGDEVYAEVEAGGFAEFVRVPAKDLALKPKNLTFEQAAAVPLSGRTALQGLRDGGRVQPGQSVLINGASGGVGTFAVQIAKALGAEVTAVCSARNTELIRSLGADHVIDYSSVDFTARPERYDVIFDSIGNHSLSSLRRTLTPTGRLVLSSGTGGRVFGPMGRIIRALAISPFVSQTLGVFSAVLGAKDLDVLRDVIESGAVTPAIDRSFALVDSPAAVRYFVEEHARAKVTISIAS